MIIIHKLNGSIVGSKVEHFVILDSFVELYFNQNCLFKGKIKLGDFWINKYDSLLSALIDVVNNSCAAVTFEEVDKNDDTIS